MKRVLLTMNDKLGRRGGPIYLLEWVKNAPKGKYQFIIYFSGELIDEALAQEFVDAGAEIHVGNISNQGRIKKNIGYIKDLCALLRKDKYDIVNVHTATPPFSAINLFFAWVYGVPYRLSHSHTAFKEENWFKHVYYLLPRIINRHLSSQYLGVSKSAVEFMFGRKAKDKALIISPRIDVKKFSFSEDLRRECRRNLSLENDNDFIVGHVGAFSPVKNHIFLLDVFRQVAVKSSHAKLMLIGTGEEEDRIKEQVHQYRLDSRVIFVGTTEKVQNYLYAMDCFVLPSLREGFPIVLLEAQTSGLPCIASDRVPSEVRITELLQRLPLEIGCEKWADIILTLEVQSVKDRKKYWKQIFDAGFDNRKFSEIIEKLYQ